MSGASSSVEKHSIGECLTENSLENHDSFPVRDQNASLILNRHAVGAERTSNYFARSNEVNMMNSQYESSLFSSSLSDIFTRKCKSLLVCFFTYLYPMRMPATELKSR